MKKVREFLEENKKTTFDKEQLDSPDKNEFKLIKKGETFQVNGKTYKAIKLGKNEITGILVKESLEESKKAEKTLDKIMSGKDGEKLAKALDKGDEDLAIKILKANKIKPNDIDDILELMFGSL